MMRPRRDVPLRVGAEAGAEVAGTARCPTVVSSSMHLAQMGVATQLPALLNAQVYVGVDLVKQSR
jgi:hypothetical protein